MTPSVTSESVNALVLRLDATALKFVPSIDLYAVYVTRDASDSVLSSQSRSTDKPFVVADKTGAVGAGLSPVTEIGLEKPLREPAPIS